MEYYALSQYLQDTFGEKVYKIALDGGFTCPNRDGTLGTRGCIFCSGAGSGDFAQCRVLSITEQLARGKERLAGKYHGAKYIAYFQAFTNTYAPVERLRALYEEAMSDVQVAVLSIATRPDCLSDEVTALLKELNRRKPVWVELGLQTIHEKIADYIRRGYALAVYDEAVRKLKEAGIQVVVHVILGLPQETLDEMKETVAYVGKSGADGIKLQLLHVLKGTDLEQEYLRGTFRTMELEEYVHLVADCIAILPPGMVIHRMTGDGAKAKLIAPAWSADKKRVLGALQKAIAQKRR